MTADQTPRDVREWMMECLAYLDDTITLDCVVDTLLNDLALGGFTIIADDADHGYQIAPRQAGMVTIPLARWEIVFDAAQEYRDELAARIPGMVLQSEQFVEQQYLDQLGAAIDAAAQDPDAGPTPSASE